MEICSCGKILYPVIKDGKQIGVTHLPDDEDWHNEFFGSYQVMLLSDQEAQGSVARNDDSSITV